MQDDDAGMLMLPLLLLNGDLEFDDSGHDKDAFLAEAPDIIPTCVAGIYEFFWRNRSRGAKISVGGNRRRKDGQRR
jgi:hypothetical protein